MIKNFTFIFLILILMFTSCKDKLIVQKTSVNKFTYKNLEINIPENFNPDKLIKNKWVDKETGLSLNIEIEYSVTQLDNYVKNMMKMINKVYNDYKIIKIEKSGVNIRTLFSEIKIKNKILNFYMIIIKLDNSKVIVTIGGDKKVFNKNEYSDFVKNIKIKRSVQDENSK